MRKRKRKSKAMASEKTGSVIQANVVCPFCKSVNLSLYVGSLKFFTCGACGNPLFGVKTQKSDTAPESYVQCEGCTACCENELVFLHQEYGDDPADYETQTIKYRGVIRTALKRQDNGDCFYLDRDKGCTIHPTRPVVCRELDCRIFLTVDYRRLIKEGLLSTEKLAAAISASERMTHSEQTMV